MSIKYKAIQVLYKTFFKPLAFMMDAEMVHEGMVNFGERLENYPSLVTKIFNYQKSFWGLALKTQLACLLVLIMMGIWPKY